MNEAELERRRVLQHGTAVEKLAALLGQKNVKQATLRHAAAAAIGEAVACEKALRELVAECALVVERWDRGDLAEAVNWMRQAKERAQKALREGEAE
ncbi:MAG: hypothetical protein ACRD3I_08720 [Terriglobales bacterium]